MAYPGQIQTLTVNMIKVKLSILSETSKGMPKGQV